MFHQHPIFTAFDTTETSPDTFVCLSRPPPREVLHRGLHRIKKKIWEIIGCYAVDLFQYRAIKRTEPWFNVRNRDVDLDSGKNPAKCRDGIAIHEHVINSDLIKFKMIRIIQILKKNGEWNSNSHNLKRLKNDPIERWLQILSRGW